MPIERHWVDRFWRGSQGGAIWAPEKLHQYTDVDSGCLLVYRCEKPSDQNLRLFTLSCKFYFKK